jgi:tetrahydromethanopterin S-methyltransferase subunit G
MSDPVLDAISRLDKRLDKLEKRLDPVVEWVTKTNGVLAVVRWVGFAGLIAIALWIWTTVTG